MKAASDSDYARVYTEYVFYLVRHAFISKLSEINICKSFFRDKSSLKLGEEYILDSKQETLENQQLDNLF